MQHPSYPTKTVHSELKESLLLDVIGDFTEGEAWEKAFELTKVLRENYENEYELGKLYRFLVISHYDK